MSAHPVGGIVAVALDRAGAHPAAWREDRVDAARILHPHWLRDLVLAAEAADVDLITVPDSFGVDDIEVAAGGPGVRLAAVEQLAAVAPVTTRIGLVPTVTTTHTEPFHIQAAIASIDFASQGRAGWLPVISRTEAEAAVVGRRPLAPEGELWREAVDVVRVGRLLWDSWEDDAEIRDVPTGRFIDRDKLHYVDFVGSTFSVKGPSIVPRPPQGHPVTVVRFDDDTVVDLAALADVVVIPAGQRQTRLPQLIAALENSGRTRDDVRVLLEVGVVFDTATESGRDRAGRLDTRAGLRRVDDSRYVGSAAGLVELVRSWVPDSVDGVHLVPAVLPTDLDVITEQVLPALRQGSVTEDVVTAEPATLRDRLRLERPVNVFAHSGAAAPTSQEATVR